MMVSQADRIRDNMEKQVADLMAEAATDFFNEVVEGTPVVSGRLRAGWKMKRGEVNPTVPKLRKGGYKSKPSAPKIAARTPGGDNTIYVSNGVPYILESNSGTLARAPTRFIQAALARTLAKFRR